MKQLVAILLLCASTCVAQMPPIVLDGLRQVAFKARPAAGGGGTIITNGLIAWWTFDGDTLDHFGSNHAGPNGGTAFTNGVKGAANTAIYFDGTSGTYVGISNAFTIPVSGTISYWMKVPSGVHAYSLYFRSALGDQQIQNQLESPNIDARYYNGGDQVFNIMTSLTPNTWCNYVETWAMNDFRYYDNGMLVYSNLTLAVTSFSCDSARSIGNSTIDPYPLTGAIDEFLIYDRPLSADEVTTNYNAEKMK